MIIYLLDAAEILNEPATLIQNIRELKEKHPQKPLLVVANKMDLLTEEEQQKVKTVLTETTAELPQCLPVFMTAKTKEGVEALQNGLLVFVNTGALKNDQSIVTNSRHYDALLKALEEITKVREGMEANLSGDLLAIDIRQALYHLGEITGEITNDELLGNIFANFCIGK